MIVHPFHKTDDNGKLTSSHPAGLLDLHKEAVVCGTVQEVEPSLLVKRQRTALVGSLTKPDIILHCRKEMSDLFDRHAEAAVGGWDDPVGQADSYAHSSSLLFVK